MDGSLLNLIEGLIILVVSIIMGAILILAPGSIRLQRPECGWVGWIFNIANLVFFFLLIPFSGFIRMGLVDASLLCCFSIPNAALAVALEFTGLLIFLAGAFLLLWSRLSLRRSFRLGGVKPASSDYLTMHGPYVHMRHPMYLSALLVLLGVAMLLGSAILVVTFFIMTYLVLVLIPREEEQLDQAYPVAYAEYCRRVPRSLFPRLFSP